MSAFAKILPFLFLTSCLPFSKYEQTKYLIDTPSIDYSLQKSLDSGFFTAGDWPEEEWWKVFNSPQLDALIQEALLNNPSIQAVQQRVEVANQLAIVARSKLYPWASFDAVYNWEYLSKNGLFRAFNPKLPLKATLYDLKFSFNYEIDIWGKNREFLLAAVGNLRAEEAEAAQVKLIITTAVAKAFATVKINQQRKDLIQKLIVVQKDLYELQDFLYTKALASQLDVLSSEENYYDVKKLLWNVDQELALSVHQLNVLTGASPDAPFDLGCSYLKPIGSLSIPCDLSLGLLARRPDLMAQIWRAEALSHDVRAAKTEYYPDINITAFLGLESVLGSKLFKPSSKTDGYKPALHLPIFTAGEIQANIDTQIALFNEAIFDYNQLLLNSAQEVADKLATAVSLFRQKNDQTELLKKLSSRYELTALRYEKGLDNLLTKDTIQEELIRKELEDLDIIFGQYTAMIDLIRALGGGYESLYIPIRAEECE